MSGVGVLALPLMILLYLGLAILGVWLIVKLLMGLGWLIGACCTGVVRSVAHVFRFVKNEIGDVLRALGGVITSLVFAPLVALNVLVGRWSKATHYGSALEDELMTAGRCIYRALVGNPAQLLGLTGLTEGIERRLPDALARAPGPDVPNRQTGPFEGYQVVGSLPSGGSGARLFLAEPRREKLEQLARAGHAPAHRVVIKSFSLEDGSTLPQIVRESRALESARQLGLVLEHELTGKRFHYVMPYVPGDDLALTTRRMHESSGPEGLDDRRLGLTLAHGADLLASLERFHRSGLWHKDVKPSNIIISDGQVHLVDLGLITPLRSALTLTTHGTEYFRDPEMVRLALRGVKVHEVDGVKFDIYSAGAVLYSMIENSFPAHGSLSQITKRCPEAVRWIVRRAMADMKDRYGSATEMLADLEAVRAARNPFKLKPLDLPSLRARPHGDSVLGQAAAYGAGAPMAAAARDARADDVARSWDALRRATPHAAPAAAQQPAAPRRRHGVLRGVLGMAAALLVMFAIAGALLLGARRSADGRYAHVAPDGHAHIALDDGSSIVHTAPGREIHVTPPRGELAAIGHLRGPAPAVPHRDVGVLVVDDLPASATPRVQDEVDEIASLLEQSGFSVLGSAGRPGRVAHVDPADEAVESAFTVRARYAVGLGDAFDAESGDRLSALVDERGDPVDALLWFDQGRDRNSYRVRIFADEDVTPALERVLRLAQRP